MVAGERSGDLHGSNLIKALLSQAPELEITCWGGDLMEEAGANVSVHYNKLAFMGIWEVIKNLGTIRKLLSQCKQELLAYKPDLIVLIDYPGFNLKIAEFAHKQSIPVHYYIAPKAWAWNASRAVKIKKYISKLYAILPFEVGFFESYNIDVEYVGNPLIDAIEDYHFDNSLIDNFDHERTVAVLPGSRYQEVNSMIGLMVDLISARSDHHFLIAAVDNLPNELYNKVESLKNAELIYDKTYDILSVSRAAIVTSGTATLETALLKCPQVVCYKTSPLTYAVGRLLVKVKFISLVNLIAGKEVVKELIQHDFNKDELSKELDKLLDDKVYRAQIIKGYDDISKKVTSKKASVTAAGRIIEALK